MASGTEFLIEIEQRMKGDSAVTELAKLGDSFTSAKARYQEFQTANEQAAKSLDKVGAQIASTSAKIAKAGAAGDTSGVERGAAALAKLCAKQNELKTASDRAKVGLDAEQKSLTEIAGKIESAKKAGAPIDPGALAAAGKGLSKFGGPLGELGGKVSKLATGWSKLTGALGVEGAAAAVAAAGTLLLAVAVVAVVAAAAIGVAKIYEWAIGLADQRREVELTARALEQMSPGLRGLNDTFAAVSSSTGVANDRLAAITRSLQQANIAGKDIPAALQAIATQESALGDSSGTQALIDQLKNGQTSASALASTMDQKFGGVVQARMLGLSEQADTLQRNLSAIFGGLKIDAFLEGLSKIVSLLDVNTESGKALKTLFETLFQPLLGSSTDVFTTIERGFLKVEIAALRVAVGVKNMTKGVDTAGLKQIETIAEAAIWPMFETTLNGIGNEILMTALAAKLTFSAWTTMGAAAINAGAAIGGLLSSAKDLPGEMASIAGDMISGFVGRITTGIADAKKAVSDLAHSVIDEARSVLDSHSPSREFAKIGRSAPDGMVDGIEDGESAVQASMSRVASPPSAAAGGGGSSRSITISGNSWTFQGVKDGESAQRSMIEELLVLLEAEGVQVAAEQR